MKSIPVDILRLSGIVNGHIFISVLKIEIYLLIVFLRCSFAAISSPFVWIISKKVFSFFFIDFVLLERSMISFALSRE